MSSWLAAPPSAFTIVLLAIWLLMLLFSRLSYRRKKQDAGSSQAYACGEENYNPLSQLDYSNFLPFAFFFTLAHVATLMMATVPAKTADNFILAILYIGGATLGLYILFRRE